MVAPPSLGGSLLYNPASAKSNPANLSNGTISSAALPTIPYSARRAAPLDMNTVERRGHPSSREPPQRNRPHGLAEAPTYRPTEEEFRDPMEYVRSISDQASKYGICKIIPPASWNPDFAIDLERFHFRTRRQELNSVEGGTRANLNYLDQLAKFHKQYGTNLNRFPSVDKRPLDLYKLKKAVEVRGGFDKVCKDKKWAEIGRDLGYSGKIMSSLSTSLKNSYQRWLHPYEEYLRTVKPGIQQQLDFEYGGQFSPSPAYSPIRRSFSQQNTSNGVSSEAPAVQTSVALNASLRTVEPVMHPTPMPIPRPPTEPVRPISSSGFVAVNSGGFAAANTPPQSGFVAVNHAAHPFVKRESEPSTMTAITNGHVHSHTPGPSVHNVPHFAQLPLGSQPLVNGNGVGSNPLKRTMSVESVNGDSGSDGANDEGENGIGRRSKRIKKDVAPMVAGSHISLMRPSTPRMRGRPSNRKPGDKCEQCGKVDDKENIVACDSCDLGYHKHCLDPALATIPDFDWHCPKCLVGTGEYGFEEGGVYSLRHFQEKANNFKEHYFAQKLQFDPVHNIRKQPSEDDVEREFWRLVESLTETVEVEYGADIHSTTHGSGFPTVEKQPLNPYSKHPWNLNVLPFHEESLFRHIKTDISGMTVPWLYVGMCFSTFCWHNEDHYTYSANYQHFGATKTWYGIPGKDARDFEEAMRRAVPELFESQPDLLFQLVTLLPPDQLRKAGVEVYALDQRAGQLVITFPQAYHAGFNHGFNFNEAVNFAPADWEPFGQAGVERLQEFRRQPCFSHDELLLTAAAMDATIKTAKWLAPALVRMRDRELRQRREFSTRHKELSPHSRCRIDSDKKVDGVYQCAMSVVVEDEELQEEEYQCYYCKAYSFLSQFQCHHTSRVSCLLHAEISDCCAESPQQRLLGTNHTLKLRYTNQQLEDLVQKVVDKAGAPEAWTSKLEHLLEDEPNPPLKAMHTLLAEGEKIPYYLPDLKSLSDFVKRCDQWVEEANQYLTRKQQNRRKNEKAWRRTSARTIKSEEKEAEPSMSIDRMNALIDEGRGLGFQCPQFEALDEKSKSVSAWRSEAKIVLRTNGSATTAADIEALLETGRAFTMHMVELAELGRLYQEKKWLEDAQNARADLPSQSLEQCKAIIKRARELGIPLEHPEVRFFDDKVARGDMWEIKAKEVMAAESVNYQQLESMNAQLKTQAFPVNPETLAAMDAILAKNREAQKQIVTLHQRSQNDDISQRPTYTEVRDVMKAVEDLNSKPNGTMDLEREVKKHEDWMRKGKKLFGKANAPLHILEAHMKTVEEKNNYCFDLNDTYQGPPDEPPSREQSPVEGTGNGSLGENQKPAFCICRQPESGMMIVCDVCHDWYHGKCLKIARGKVNKIDTFTCPICDWRVKIPRDAARPKLEDLQYWADEISGLPFQPEEEELLKRIIDKAQAFRDFLRQYIEGPQICRTSEEMWTIAFYLRKIEGAEVLLARETNVFRQDLHKWQPIAPEPPPMIKDSLSTRKPRPTKQQKIMKEMGVEKIEDLPPHLRMKQATRRKNTDASSSNGSTRPPPLQPADQMQRQSSGAGSIPGQIMAPSDTPIGLPRQASTGNPPTNGPSPHSDHTQLLAMGQTEPFRHNPFINSTGPQSYGSHSPSSMFSPETSMPPSGLRDPMMASAFSGGPAGAADPSFDGIFNPSFAMAIGDEDDIRTGLASTNGGSAAGNLAPEHLSSPTTGDVDGIFAEMTNEEPETQGHGDPEAAPTTLRQEAHQVCEALEIMGSPNREEDSSADAHIEDANPEKSGFEEFFGEEQA